MHRFVKIAATVTTVLETTTSVPAQRQWTVTGQEVPGIESRNRVITYASVIDNTTNDGTAITMKR